MGYSAGCAAHYWEHSYPLTTDALPKSLFAVNVDGPSAHQRANDIVCTNRWYGLCAACQCLSEGGTQTREHRRTATVG